jgi:hypothetical protein
MPSKDSQKFIDAALKEFHVNIDDPKSHSAYMAQPSGPALDDGYPTPLFVWERIRQGMETSLFVLNSSPKIVGHSADLMFRTHDDHYYIIRGTWLPYDLSDYVKYLRDSSEFMRLVLRGFITIIPRNVALHIMTLPDARKERERIDKLRTHLYTPTPTTEPEITLPNSY